MDERLLGRARRHVGVVGLGAWQLGADWGAVSRLLPLVPPQATMAQLALRWILDLPGVSAVIPGARSPAQVLSNVGAADLPPLPPATNDRIREVYAELVRPLVHDRW